MSPVTTRWGCLVMSPRRNPLRFVSGAGGTAISGGIRPNCVNHALSNCVFGRPRAGDNPVDDLGRSIAGLWAEHVDDLSSAYRAEFLRGPHMLWFIGLPPQGVGVVALRDAPRCRRRRSLQSPCSDHRPTHENARFEALGPGGFPKPPPAHRWMPCLPARPSVADCTFSYPSDGSWRSHARLRRRTSVSRSPIPVPIHAPARLARRCSHDPPESLP